MTSHDDCTRESGESWLGLSGRRMGFLELALVALVVLACEAADRRTALQAPTALDASMALVRLTRRLGGIAGGSST